MRPQMFVMNSFMKPGTSPLDKSEDAGNPGFCHVPKNWDSAETRKACRNQDKSRNPRRIASLTAAGRLRTWSLSKLRLMYSVTEWVLIASSSAIS